MSKSAPIALALFLCFAGRCTADSVVLRHGLNSYMGTGDTTLFEEFPNNSSGGFPFAFAGQTLSGARRTMYRFDLSAALPAGAVITSASLSIFSDFGQPGEMICALHPMTRAWNPGTNPLVDLGTVGQGAPAQPGDPTWTHAAFVTTDTVLWTPPGGEFAAPPSAQSIIGNPGTSVFSSLALAQDVQNWADNPSQNFGWILIGNETTPQTAKRLISSEGPVPEQRPALFIEFTNPSGIDDWQAFD